MPSRESRKAAIRDFKLRPPNRGVFAVRCTASGHVWVGASPNLDAARNATVAALRMGSHRERAIQDAWNAHGEAAFQFEILETLDPDLVAMSVGDTLKAKKREWAERLSAPALL